MFVQLFQPVLCRLQTGEKEGWPNNTISIELDTFCWVLGSHLVLYIE